MADATFREVVIIDARDDASAALQRAQRVLNQYDRTVSRVRDANIVARLVDNVTAPLRSIKSALSDVVRTAAGFALGQGIANLPGFLYGAAKAAAEDASGVDMLRKAVENTGASWSQYEGQLNNVINNGIRLGFADDQQRDALSLLEAQTGSTEESQKRLALAMDLSRGAHIDLTTAAKLLGKANDENVNVLSRYGVQMKKGASEAELFGAVQAKFGGQAETFAQSAQGQMEAFTLQMGELRESIGYLVLPILSRLATFANRRLVPALNAGVEVIGKGADALGKRLSPAMVTGRAIIEAFTGDVGALGIVVAQVREVFGDSAGDFLDPFLAGLARIMPELRDMGGILKDAIMSTFTGGLGPTWAEVAGNWTENLGGVWEDTGQGIDFLAAGRGIAESLARSITDGLAAVDWTAAGRAVSDGVKSGTEGAGGIKQAADASATAYVQAFADRVRRMPPVKVPGMDKSVGVGAVASPISGKGAADLGKFGVAFAGIAPVLLIAAHYLPMVVGGVSALATAVGAGVAAFSAGAVAIGAFLLPILLIAAAIAALYVIWTNDVGGIQEITASVLAGVAAFFTDTLLPAIQQAASWIQANLPVAIQAATDAFTAIWDVVRQFLPDWSEIAPHADALWQSLQELVAAVLPAAQSFAESLIPAVKEAAGFFKDVGEVALPVLRDILMALAPIIKEVLTGAINALIDVVKIWVDILKVGLPAAISVAKLGIEGITDGIRYARDIWQRFADTVASVVSSLKELSGMSLGDVANSALTAAGYTGPRFADGGIVTRPTLALVGEEGPEAIVPLGNRASLGQGSRGGGGGGGVNVVIGRGAFQIAATFGGTEPEDLEEFADALADPMMRAIMARAGRPLLSQGLVGG